MLGIGGPGPEGSINPSTFTGSPGYQYNLQQSQNAITNAASTKGGVGGNQLLALQQNASGLANQNWGQYLSNATTAWQQLLGNVGGQSQQGLNAAGVLSGAGQNNANAQSNILGAIGNTQSQGTLGQAGVYGSALNNLTALGVGAGNSLNGGTSLTSYLNSLFNSGSGGVGNLPSTSNPFGAISSDASNPLTYG